jgi:PBP1b-binding outer membrane lipoprotein LpoB
LSASEIPSSLGPRGSSVTFGRKIMKTKTPIVIIAVLLAGCATQSANQEAAQTGSGTTSPSTLRTTGDINLNDAFQRTAESNARP